jgi:hypothetical protein
MNRGRRVAVMLTLFATVGALACCSSPTDAEANSGCSDGEVVGWGDSLTYAVTKIGDRYVRSDPTWLQTLGEDLGVETKNFGGPSEGSAEIAVRQGGLKPTVTLSGGEIPAGTVAPIAVTAITPIDGWTQYRDAHTMKMHGTLAGVSGTLQHTIESGQESFTFVPDTAPGQAVPAPPEATFTGDQGDDYRACTQIIWAGTNNHWQPEAVKRDIASMVGRITYPKRYLVIGTVPGIENEFAAAYGAHFVDLREWLISDGLSAAGVAPTPEDVQAIANNQVPPSLRVDSTHFTQAAYTAIGHHLASVLKAQT